MKIFKCNGLSIKMLVYNTILVSILLTIFYGCAQENPLLYDTTRRDSSVSIRFINMSNDGLPRLFSMDGTFGFSQTEFGACTESFVSPLDSVHYSLLSNGKEQYSTKVPGALKKSFYRSTIQTYISGQSSTNTDSSILIQSSVFKSNSLKGNASLKVINMIADSSFLIDITLGCQNGIPLGNGLSNTSISNDVLISSGFYTITLKNKRTNEIIGMYANNTISFSKDSIYTLILSKSNKDKSIRVFVLNELDLTSSAIKEIQLTSMLESELSIINLSSIQTDIKRDISGQQSDIVSSVDPLSIISKKISVCLSSLEDHILINQTGFTQLLSTSFINFAPSSSYAAIIVDSMGYKAGKTFLFSLQKPQLKASTSSIKIVNADYSLNGLSIGIGARTSDNGQFQSGSLLVQSLKAGDISQPLIIPSGILPITILSSTLPQKLINQWISTIQSGMSYIIIIEKQRVTCIEESSLQKFTMDQGTFTQIVHAANSERSFTCSLDNVLVNAPLFVDGVLGTVVKTNKNVEFSFNGSIPVKYSTHADSSLFICVSDNYSAISYNYPTGGIFYDKAGLRVINLLKDSSIIYSLDYDPITKIGIPIFSNIIPGTSSSYHYVDRDRRLSFGILSNNTQLPLSLTNNISISTGKNYSFIVLPNGLITKVIIRQEF